MELVYGNTLHDVALVLREVQWNKFVNAAGIRAAVQSDSLVARDVRKAWDLANPVSKYVAAAEAKAREDSSINFR